MELCRRIGNEVSHQCMDGVIRDDMIVVDCKKYWLGKLMKFVDERPTECAWRNRLSGIKQLRGLSANARNCALHSGDQVRHKRVQRIVMLVKREPRHWIGSGS